MYELILLILFVVGEDDVPSYRDAISNLGLRIWQPLCLSIMTYAASGAFNKEFADLTKKTRSAFAYFFVNLLVILGYLLLTLGFAINRDDPEYPLWPFFIVWVLFIAVPAKTRGGERCPDKRSQYCCTKKGCTKKGGEREKRERTLRAGKTILRVEREKIKSFE